MHLQVFLQELFAKIETTELPGVDISPKDKVEKGETVIGTLNGELQRFFAVKEKMIAEINAKLPVMKDYARDMYLEKADSEKVIALREFALQRRRMSIVDNIFWQMVRESLFIDPKMVIEGKGTGLREEWKVVIYDDQPPSNGIVMINLGAVKGCSCAGCKTSGGCGPHNPGA